MSFSKVLLIIVVINLFLCQVNSKSKRSKLMRKKRYVTFPEGASFSAVICLTSQMGITDGAAIFSEGLNYGLVYELPNDTKPLFEHYGAAQKRRNRRDLYDKMENILTSMGYNGRGCILRSLCEASQFFKPREESLIHHILGLIFRFPSEPIMPHEPDDHRIYHWATETGNMKRSREYCNNNFECPFSLIEMALGYHSSGNSFLVPDLT